MRYRKKPVEIEAIQFTGLDSVQEMCKTWNTDKIQFVDSYHQNTQSVYVTTPEGVMMGWFGCWIIKGIKGEFYPCKQDIFEQTYEECK